MSQKALKGPAPQSRVPDVRFREVFYIFMAFNVSTNSNPAMFSLIRLGCYIKHYERLKQLRFLHAK